MDVNTKANCCPFFLVCLLDCSDRYNENGSVFWCFFAATSPNENVLALLDFSVLPFALVCYISFFLYFAKLKESMSEPGGVSHSLQNHHVEKMLYSNSLFMDFLKERM